MMPLGALVGLVRGLPRPLLYLLGGVLAAALVWRWHGSQISAAFAAGGRAQLAADTQRFAAAGAAAASAQAAVAAKLAVRQSEISKGAGDALAQRSDDLDRGYDDLRLRWAAYRRDAGTRGATAVSGAAGGVDDKACTAGGWVSFDIAAAAAEAADLAIAKDDAWIAWVGAQEREWVE
ncbi:hypothetical protein GCM10011529_28980 [Polymorphobacter glacialis]|uniref:Uncharacterized protein n=1 Tax=Sandarakinorhabdus glacialis TaxID=1614636 RepID=A0A917EB62_9SPHN|nr:hypothetical protein [Polymorphobacter glacialis]GGE20516.1 hypothetical protein GCM10011529_28980 [Polymorphobacter glacialis]